MALRGGAGRLRQRLGACAPTRPTAAEVTIANGMPAIVGVDVQLNRAFARGQRLARTHATNYRSCKRAPIATMAEYRLQLLAILCCFGLACFSRSVCHPCPRVIFMFFTLLQFNLMMSVVSLAGVRHFRCEWLD